MLQQTGTEHPSLIEPVPLDILDSPAFAVSSSPIGDQDTSDMESIAYLLQTSEVVGEGYQIVPVGNAGYVVRLGERPARTGNDWALFDLDDTLIGYTEAKKARPSRYQIYAQETGLDIDSTTANQLINITDRFSRWEVDGAQMYHIKAHKSALAWATTFMRGVPPEQIETATEYIIAQLEQVKQGSVDQDEDVPFRFANNRLYTTPSGVTEEDMDRVFEPTSTPPIYDDALNAMVEVGGLTGDECQVNVGIFTYGEPEFQLSKALDLMRVQTLDAEPSPVSQIWLTTVPKGEFMKELAKVLEENDSENSNSTLHQEIFSQDPHILLLVDDDPEAIEGFMGSQATLGRSLTGLGVLRSLRQATKTQEHPWGQVGHSAYQHPEMGVFDARDAIDETFATSVFVYLRNNLSTLVRVHNGEVDMPTDPALVGSVNNRIDYYDVHAPNSKRPRILEHI